ncbi:hypothetical protein NPIL_599031 [Nephila pilipes]|uniref:Uncharacterized protein n=1 Tax=Nephila pilipes TaxID=299642 RepID=A0A8X6TGS7_NEPPI|nr:hypothetical protein NPIL_599031 [Nephila pilipes]
MVVRFFFVFPPLPTFYLPCLFPRWTPNLISLRFPFQVRPKGFYSVSSMGLKGFSGPSDPPASPPTHAFGSFHRFPDPFPSPNRSLLVPSLQPSPSPPLLQTLSLGSDPVMKGSGDNTSETQGFSLKNTPIVLISQLLDAKRAEN